MTVIKLYAVTRFPSFIYIYGETKIIISKFDKTVQQKEKSLKKSQESETQLFICSEIS